jgi:plastocyanin
MARRGAIVITAAFVIVLIVPAIPAGAGGGCHAGVTRGTGDTVELVDACFTPTTLQIRPGDTVTFVNEDPFVHNAGGNLWGHFEDLNSGDTFTATFDQQGIYPYACSYHPGMTGAIVVGDGLGIGNGTAVDVSSLSPPEPSPLVEVRTLTRRASAAPAVVGWVVGPLLGIGIGLGIAALVRRRPRSAA